jgi:hypothetical protein
MGWLRARSRPDPPEPDKVVELAYNAAVKAIEQQDATLGNLRNRAAGLLSAITIATSFTAGLGLFSTDPAKGALLSTWSKWLLLALLVVTGALSISVMWPANFTFGVDATKILDKHKEERTLDGVRLYVIEALVAGHRHNNGVLRRKFRLYRVAVTALTAEITVLVIALIV